MHQNLFDHIRLHDEADDLHLSMAPGTGIVHDSGQKVTSTLIMPQKTVFVNFPFDRYRQMLIPFPLAALIT